MPSARFAAWSDEVAATFALGWPMVATQLAQIALATTDVLLLGRLGPEAVAAGALAVNLFNAVMLFGIGVMTAITPLVASERGRRANSVRDVRRTFHQSIWVAALLSAPAWAVLWHGEAIFTLLGQDPALSHEAAKLMRVLMWTLFPLWAYVGLRSFVAAFERPMWPLIVGLLAVPVNAAIGWLLIFGHLGAPRLGIVGAGCATLLTNVFLVAALSAVLVGDRRFRRYHLFGRIWRPDLGRIRDVLRLGLPIGGMIAFEATEFNAAAFLAGLIGTTTLAAHAVTLQIASTAFMIPLGLAQAVTVRVGLAWGRGDGHAVRRAGWIGYAIVLAVMLATAVTLLAIPERLIGAFLEVRDDAGRETFELALSFLRLAAFFQIADGIQVVTAGMLRGRHDTRVPMIVAAIGYWGVGFVGSVLLAFPGGFGGRGVWMGLALGLGSVAIMLTLRWHHLTRRTTTG